MLFYFNGWGFALEREPQTRRLKTEKLLSLIIIIIIIIIEQIIVSVNYIYILSGSFFSASLEPNKGKAVIVLVRTCNSETKRKYITH